MGKSEYLLKARVSEIKGNDALWPHVCSEGDVPI